MRAGVLPLNWFGIERAAAIARRFHTRTGERTPGKNELRIGFVFGPRALRRVCGRPFPVVVTDRVGEQHTESRRFRDASTIARFWVTELNRSFVRARIGTRARVGAVAQFDADDAWPRGPHPGAWLADLCDGRIAVD